MKTPRPRCLNTPVVVGFEGHRLFVEKQSDKNGASEHTCCLGSGFLLQILEVLFDGVEGLFSGQAPAAATASFGVVLRVRVLLFAVCTNVLHLTKKDRIFLGLIDVTS